jgi:adenine-specific DNA-methyltransferase
MQKTNRTSSNLAEEKLIELYRILPEAFAENKVDFDKLRAVLGDSIQTGSEKFSFSWAGKSNAIKNVLVPSKLTLNPKPEESIKWDESENLFIEGDNLEVLKLLQKAYFEKVKMIYIDPPYNTGHDFVYNDDFSAPLDNYLKQTGQKTDAGEIASTNKETNGRYHSDWLSMMYPRLKLAWNLLREDGVIFVSIDDNEVHHLRMLMNEVFGEENFVASIMWEKKYSPQNDATYFSDMHDYILCYAKKVRSSKNTQDGFVLNLLERTEEQNARYQNPDNDPRGPWKSSDMSVKTYSANYDFEITTPAGRKVTPPRGRCWRFGREKYEAMLKDNRVWFGSDGQSIPSIKRFLSEVQQGIVPSTLWFRKDVGDNQEAAKEIRDIFIDPPFDTPKPTRLIQRIISLSTSPDNEDIVLDFFAGSSTTAHAVLKQNFEDDGNRKFIMVQLPEKLEKESKQFKTISDVSIERIKRVIKGYGENPQPIDAGLKVFTLSESNYPENTFAFDPEKSSEENQKAFVDYLNKAKQSQLFDNENDTSLVFENIVKEGLSLNSKVEKISIGKNNMYKVTDGEQQLLICLENKLATETVKELTDKSHKDKLFICLESALDDTTAANLSLNLDLKTI